MGLRSSKQTQQEAVRPGLTPEPKTINSNLITKQPESRIIELRILNPISNLTPNSNGLRQNISNRRPLATYSEPQWNFNDLIKALTPISRTLPAPRALIRNREFMQALLQHLEVPHSNCFPYNQLLFLELILEGSICYDFVMAKFWNKKFNCNYTIVSIHRVWNPYLMAQYMLTKKKGENNLVEKYLFHGTSQEALSGVLKDNFNWRKVVLGKWGWGVSFANNPWYSSHYSKRKQQHENWPCVMVLVKVLVEDGAICQGNSLTMVPTTGYTTTNPTKEVIVKYDDASFYPEFIVHFKEKTCF
ncbi:probable poly [ADP-ribose] polymerase DDB_G0278045 [Euwallacea similis]|uniref:probable poly [ADP-ribose] polymerase DDB_G0278045 n=1 Tax=Euwallacea similis TaxID=1736056 RepID=UPI00344B8ADE